MSSCWYSHSFGQTVGGQKSSKTSACSKTLWDDKSYKLKQRCLTPPSFKRTLSSSNNIWRHLPEVMNQFSNALKFRISTMNYFFYGQLLNMNCIFSWRKFQKVADSKKFWLWIIGERENIFARVYHRVSLNKKRSEITLITFQMHSIPTSVDYIFLRSKIYIFLTKLTI